MRRMITGRELHPINGDVVINDSMTVQSNGDVITGGKINGIPKPPTVAGSYKLVVATDGAITWEVIE